MSRGLFSTYAIACFVLATSTAAAAQSAATSCDDLLLAPRDVKGGKKVGPSSCVMQEADITYENGVPKLARQRVILESKDLPFRCTLETQNFVPPEENKLTFSAYGYNGTDVGLVELATKKVVDLTNSPDEYDEPEGIFPDGQFTLVECDRQNRKGAGYVDLWKLRLDGGGYVERLTYFSDYPGYKSSNPVISDDGRYMAFQMARSKDPAGVGYGIFVFDLAKAVASRRP